MTKVNVDGLCPRPKPQSDSVSGAAGPNYSAQLSSRRSRLGLACSCARPSLVRVEFSFAISTLLFSVARVGDPPKFSRRHSSEARMWQLLPPLDAEYRA
jgi:hypothetical protein